MLQQARTSLSLALLMLSIAALSQPTPALSQTRPSPRHSASSGAGPTPPELRATRAFNSAKSDPLQLHAFLVQMPKGADLHMHLSGAVYAETFIADGRADLLCIHPSTLAFTKNIGTTRSIPPQPVCAEGDLAASAPFDLHPAKGAHTGQPLYNALVDSFSLRAYVPSPDWSGHDQFFASFSRFGGLAKSHTGEWLDEVASRAASQNEQYLEIMETPAFSHAAKLGAEIGWPATPPTITPNTSTPLDITGTTTAELSALRDKLLAAGLRDEVATDRTDLTDALRVRRQIEHCGEPNAAPACSVEIRFLYQLLRSNPPEQVFAQALLGFEVAAAEANSGHPIVVGINLVQPEDDFLAMSEYTRQMRMLDYLHTVYPQVHISLHAGEVAPGLVPPSGLRFHIRQAIDLGHAERIGHGVDIMYEDDPAALLKEMAERHIMTEINLTSNDIILGVSLNRHSLPAYRAAHVPVALSTDDEGVSRIDLTHEYVRAATDFNLSYLDLKDMARTSLEHSFLPGPSLWPEPDNFTHPVAACARANLGADDPPPSCLAFLRSSPRAAQQWQLEHRYAIFESSLP